MKEVAKSKRIVISFKLVNRKRGTMLGEPDDTAETLIAVLNHKFSERLATAVQI